MSDEGLASKNQPLLRVESVTRRFRSGSRDLTVLDQVSFDVAPGETVAVVGPSGSGKSTLLGLIAGLDEPSSGRVLVDGRDLTSFREAELAAFRGQRMGFLFQSYRLLPAMTALENVRIPLDLAGSANAQSQALQWLDRVGLADRASHLPVQLSGGEQQRVALARALVCQPALLFADEPTGNLDAVTGQTIVDLIFNLVREHRTACIFVTHDATLAQRADRIIRLADGRVVSAAAA